MLTPFLRSLARAGTLPGSTGDHRWRQGSESGRKEGVPKRVLIQRCQWHKRENVVSYLSKASRRRCASGCSRPTTGRNIKRPSRPSINCTMNWRSGTNPQLRAWRKESRRRSHCIVSACTACWGRSFKTTNCLESVNALVEERCAKVDHWKNSSQRQRWLATALVDIEPRLRRVIGYRHLRSFAKLSSGN